MEENKDCVAEQENPESKEVAAVETAVAEKPEEVKAPETAKEQVEEKKTTADEKPPRGSRYELISIGGWVGILLLLAVPVVGPVLVLVWALGGCRKQQKRNFARASVIVFLISLVLSAALAFVAVQAVRSVMEEIEVQLAEQFNVSSIEEVGKLVEGVVTGNFAEGSEEVISDMIGSYIGSEVELSAEEQAQLNEVIDGVVKGEITIEKEDLEALLGKLEG